MCRDVFFYIDVNIYRSSDMGGLMLDLFCCGIWLLLGFLDVIAFRKVDTEARSQDREEDEGADVETEERALAGSWHVSG